MYKPYVFITAALMLIISGIFFYFTGESPSITGNFVNLSNPAPVLSIGSLGVGLLALFLASSEFKSNLNSNQMQKLEDYAKNLL